MSAENRVKAFPEPAVNEREILRYAGVRTADAAVSPLLSSCLSEALPVLTYRAAWRELPVRTDGDLCDLGELCFHSAGLAKNLAGCDRVVVFAATVGTPLDRLIAKYARLSPSRAVLLHAVGAERVEALCDALCAQLAEEYGRKLRPRFSPGYGDLPLTLQPQILSLLEAGKRLGITLSESLLMSPSKSVTAFTGIPADGAPAVRELSGCALCGAADCEYRGKS